MGVSSSDLHDAPNLLSPHYSSFHLDERVLLTGHSHQAWPDVAREGLLQGWTDASRGVDDKWSAAFAVASRVRRGFRRWMGDAEGPITLAQNTHELVCRFLSALDLDARPRVVITDGEFHSISRQMRRLEEEGVEVVRVSSTEVDALPEALIAAIDGKTACVLVSAVFFHSSRIVRGLSSVVSHATREGVPVLVDCYHALGPVPFSLSEWGLENAYVVGGGYKYLQLGEGNCFLRTPVDCELRPVNTGWFADFEHLDAPATVGAVHYAPGDMRFAGATYDPISHYRAARVMDFFEEQGLTPQLLRDVSQHQLRVLADAFDALDVNPADIDRDRSVPLHELGGFLTLKAPRAAELVSALRRLGVFADARGDNLRLGPAPYLSDDRLESGVSALPDALESLAR